MSAHPLGRRFVAQAEGQDQCDISQSFRFGADGLRGVSVYPVAPGSFGSGDVTLELWEAEEGDPARSDLRERLARRLVIRVSTFLRDSQFTWTFDPIDNSTSRRYRMLAQLPRGLALEATRIKRQPTGVLFVVDRPVWGSLVFDTTATRATVAQRILYRMRRHETWPVNLVALALVTFVGHLALLDLLLVAAGSKPVPVSGADGVAVSGADPEGERRLARVMVRVSLALLLLVLGVEAAARLKVSVQLGDMSYLSYHGSVLPPPAPPTEAFVREVLFVPVESPSNSREVIAFGTSVSGSIANELSRQLRDRGTSTVIQNTSSTQGSAVRYSVRFAKNSLILIEDMLLPAAHHNFVVSNRALLPLLHPTNYWALYRNSVLFVLLDEKVSLSTIFTEHRLEAFANESLLRVEDTLRNAQRTGARVVFLLFPNYLSRGEGRGPTQDCGIAVDGAYRRLRALLTQYGVRYVDLYGDHNDVFTREDFSDPIHLNDSGSRKAVDLILQAIAADLRD